MATIKREKFLSLQTHDVVENVVNQQTERQQRLAAELFVSLSELHFATLPLQTPANRCKLIPPNVVKWVCDKYCIDVT